MVVGDVVNDVLSLLTTTTITFQPAAGVEVVITFFGSENTVAAQSLVDYFDGAIIANCFEATRGNTTDEPDRLGMKMFINNTNYLRYNNANAGTIRIAFAGIQTQ